jgi:ribokinase
MFRHQIDFLAVGDITTDAFIRLKDARVNCDIKHENCQLCVRFGDKVPYEFVEIVRAVGNSANAAVSAARLGLSSGLVANIGDDQNGTECLDVLKSEKVDTSYIIRHKDIPTNYHYVLWYESERTILVKHQQYPYKLPSIGTPKWLYISSLGENTLDYHGEIIAHLEKHKEIKVAFQPGTFQINLGFEKLKGLYEKTEVFICNKEEAKKILGNQSDDIKTLLSEMRKRGPKIVLITDGPAGGYFHDGNNFWFMPPYPDPKPAYNRTGAGDAFASTFVSALALGKTPEEAMRMAPINSMSVVQKIGAQRGLLHLKDFEEYLAKAPEDYKLKQI